MADEKISAMPPASALGGSELLAMVQSGSNVACPVTTLDAYYPTTSSHWKTSNPTSQTNALDRLAAAVAGLLGGSIP